MQLSKKTLLGLMVLNALLWLIPFVESVNRDARSMQDLSNTSNLLLILGLAVFTIMMMPFFLWIWNWLKKWINGDVL